MLGRELNELLTRTGPGTPMGEVFRRFWLPVAISSEVARPDGPPLRLRVLHEDLVLFRDTSGKLGLVAAHCSHRLAPLFFGRNEECGLRCPYHGWKFDVNGACVDMPNVPQGQLQKLREKAAITSYPVIEAGSVVWAYMGPAEHKPGFPLLEAAHVPPGFSQSHRWLQRTNWAQGVEGEIDTAHISFLHKYFDPATNPLRGGGSELAADGMPEMSLRDTDYGFHYGARRNLKDEFYWRITHWLAPTFSLIPRGPGPYNAGGGRAWVPVDDNNVMTFTFFFRTDRPVDADDQARFESGIAFPPRLEKKAVRLGNASVIDTFVPVANIDNDYLVNRDMQRDVNYSGIYGANDQDRALQESMATGGADNPGIVDRRRELLVASDIAVVAMRQRMIALAQAIERGEGLQEPHVLAAQGQRPVSFVSRHGDYDALLADVGDALKAPDFNAGAGA